MVSSCMLNQNVKAICSWVLEDDLFDTFPIVTDRCNYMGERSYKGECSDNNSSATISFYSNTQCSGNPYKTANATSYDCSGDSSGDCDEIRMEKQVYINSEECNGTADVEGEVYYPKTDDLCVGLFDASIYGDYDISDEGIVVKLKSTASCGGQKFGIISITNGCNISTDNATLVELYDVGAGSSISTKFLTQLACFAFVLAVMNKG